jgi:hypothetical protein
MGLWNDQTGMPTTVGIVNAGQQYGNALLMGTTAPGSPIAAKWAAQGDQLGLTSTYKPVADDAPLLVYHGLKPGHDAAGHMFVTTDQKGAEFHGPVTAYQVRPGAKVFADLEGGTKETGLETLLDPKYGGSSAIIHRADLMPLTNMPVLYHGTRETMTQFKPGETYLVDQPDEAMGYARGGHLGGKGSGSPQVLAVEAKPGSTLDANPHIADAMDEGDDVGDAVEAAIKQARAQGHRYVTYQHPSFSGGGDQNVTVSLYPHQDLQIVPP